MADLVTGTAVPVELRVARLASRTLAFGIDLALMLLLFGLLLLGFSLSGAFDDADAAFAATVGVVVLVGVFIVAPVTVETLTRGRSAGKAALGLRVVREDGGPIRFRHALARGLAGFVVDFGVLSLFSGVIGLVAALVSERGRRIGDVLAGTVVVHERAPKAPAFTVRMPPELAGWAPALSLSQLPDPLALQARQFLQRVEGLDAGVRTSLGDSLAAAVAAHVSPEPPPGTPAEDYLAAVLAERRRRADDRLAAQRAAATPAPADAPPAPTGVPQPREAPVDDRPAAAPGGGFTVPR